jgi:hypothetical protein
MRRTILFPTVGVIVVASAALVSAGPEATTYYACVNKHSGTLRIVAAQTTCLQSENMISWNSVGPQGAPGPTGPTGPSGQGPGYVTNHVGETPDIPKSPDRSVIETLRGLPPGHYVVTAAAGFMVTDQAGIGWTKILCALESPAGLVFQSALYYHYATIEEGQYSYTDQIPIVAGFVTDETTDLSIVCSASDAGVVSLPSIISAIPVTSLELDSSLP